MSNLLQLTERGLVSLLLRNAQLIDDLGLTSRHFTDVIAGETYACIERRVANGHDVTEALVATELSNGSTKKEDNLYDQYVSWACGDGARMVVAGEHVSAGTTIRDEYTRRETLEVLNRAADSLETGGDTGNTVQSTIDKLERLGSEGVRERPTLFTEINFEFNDIAKGTGRRSGLPTGVGLESVVPGGIPRDKVTVLFGETGTFKTTLKSNIIDAIAGSGLGTVLDFSLEDSNELTRQRAISRATGVPYSVFATREFTKEHISKLKSFDKSKLLRYNNVTVIGDVPPTADEIIRIARKYKRQGLVAVVVDYLTMLDWGRNGERQMLNDAMVKFQRAAKRDNTAYIIVSQLNDDKLHDRKRFDARPKLRDLFGSSAVKNAAKLAVATYRPAKYPITTNYDKDMYGHLAESNPKEYADIIELWVRKNILGQDNVPVYVKCNRETGLMTPYKLTARQEECDYIQ